MAGARTRDGSRRDDYGARTGEQSSDFDTLSELEDAKVADCGLDEDDVAAVQEFMRDIVLTSNNPQKVREFFGTFIEEIVIGEEAVDVAYRKDRLLAVHSDSEWLPDLGSNQGPAD
jgi:hypothetical protein